MNHYNLAVTVGPNIFRPKEVTPQDLFNAGIYYDVMIKMMQNTDYIFEEDKQQTTNFMANFEEDSSSMASNTNAGGRR